MCQAAVYDEVHANEKTFTAAVQKYQDRKTTPIFHLDVYKQKSTSSNVCRNSAFEQVLVCTY